MSDRKLAAAWLFTVCAMLLVMITLGGATRLTGSGLSIMEWNPIGGALPPMSDSEWQRLFALYQQTSQYKLLNNGFGIDGFKHIFWLEWVHRFWGRLIGVVFIVPLAILWWRGAIDRWMRYRLLLFFCIGGFQGFVGWFMVASGFMEGSTAVSAYRLVVHLVLALVLYSAILWTALSIWRPDVDGPVDTRLRTLVRVCAALVGITVVAGGFVAGLKAGFGFNTFPLMGDSVVPPGYSSMDPFLRNLTENWAAVQFNHRLLATVTAVAILVTAVIGWRMRPSPPLRTALISLGAVVVIQYVLGVVTLLWVVPIPIAAAHQAVAVLLLSASILAMHASRRA